MNINCIKVGYLRTNCYILEKDNKVLVFDPADEYLRIKEVIGDNEVVGVIITHHHPDHVGALEYFDADVIYDFYNLEEGVNEIGPFKFEIIYTPGHKEDSITTYFKDDKFMITGDFLFYQSIGRTDFPGGSNEAMISSLKKIIDYPNDVMIYPGHGKPSVLGNEKTYIVSLL